MVSVGLVAPLLCIPPYIEFAQSTTCCRAGCYKHGPVCLVTEILHAFGFAGYINEFEFVDDHRGGKLVVELNGRYDDHILLGFTVGSCDICIPCGIQLVIVGGWLACGGGHLRTTFAP